MPTKQVDPELTILCEIVVAGKDKNIAVLTKPALEKLLGAGVGSGELGLLDWCKIAAEAYDMLTLPDCRYAGGYDGNDSYSFAFIDGKRNALITLNLT